MNDLRQVWGKLDNLKSPPTFTEPPSDVPHGNEYLVTLNLEGATLQIVTNPGPDGKLALLTTRAALDERLRQPVTALSLLNTLGERMLAARVYIRPLDNAIQFEMLVPLDADPNSETSLALLQSFVTDVDRSLELIFVALKSYEDGLAKLKSEGRELPAELPPVVFMTEAEALRHLKETVDAEELPAEVKTFLQHAYAEREGKPVGETKTASEGTTQVAPPTRLQ